MDAIDKRLHQLAAERTDIGPNSPKLRRRRAIAEMGRRLKAIGDEIEADELRWLELSEQIEALSATAS